MSDYEYGHIRYVKNAGPFEDAPENNSNLDMILVGGWAAVVPEDLLTRAEWETTTKPAYYQTSKGIDPEDVLIDWLTEHGVDKENAYNMAHHLVHSVLYSAARAVKRAREDTQFWPDAAIEEGS